MAVFPLYWVTVHIRKIQSASQFKNQFSWEGPKPWPQYMKTSDDYAQLFLQSQMFLLHKSLINSMWSLSETLLHTRQSHAQTMQGLFLLPFWTICDGAAPSFFAFLLVSSQLTTCIMPGGHPPSLVLLLSSLCYSFAFIPTSYKLSQTELFMSDRNYPLQLIFHQEIHILRN